MAHCRYASLTVLCSSLLVLGSASLTSGAQAASTWINPGEGNWSLGSNWDTGNPPGYWDNGSVNNGGTIIIDGNDAYVYTLYIGNATTESGTVIMNNGLLKSNAEILVGEHGTGTFILNGGLVEAGWEMKIADLTGSVGHVIVNGGQITTAKDNNFVVGRGGTGTLELNNNGRVTTDFALIGGEIWRNGLVAQGTGTVVLNDNSLFDNTSNIALGLGPISSGTVTVNDNSTMTTKAGLYVGYAGYGELTVNGGTVNAVEGVSVGTVAGATGIVNLNGGVMTTRQLIGEDGSALVTFNGGTLRALANKSDFIDGFGAIQVGAGGATIDSNGYNIASNSGFSGAENATLIKAGAGTLNINADNSAFLGLLRVDAGILSLSQANTFANAASVQLNNSAIVDTLNTEQQFQQLSGANGTTLLTGNSTITLNNVDGQESTFAGVITGNGVLNKTGNGLITLAGAGSTQGNINVQQGTLALAQNGLFTTTGNYTTQSGATSMIGAQDAKLQVNGAFTQQSGSVLNVTLGASPDITAQTANLDGQLIVNGFADTEDPTRASGVVGQDYVVLHTTGGITGEFNNNPLEPYSLDYLLHDGHTINDDHDYALGFRLAWTEGEQQYSTGNFTLNADTAFNVDIALENQTLPAGGFATGWDGKSLMKDGAGRLVLSKVNGYTGSTTVENGTLQLDVADSIKASSEVIVNGGIVNLNGNDQQFNRLSGNGGEVQLNGATLTAVNADSTVNSDYAGAITGNGTLVKDGSGSLTLSGNTAWVGDTELQGGSLILDGANGGAQLTSNVIGQSGTQLSLINGASLTGWIDPTHVDIDSRSQWTMTAD
ncbi:hypothetical protein C9426_34460, partial [Serratia sp. S1B]